MSKNYYFDTSSLVKKYIQEKDSAAISKIFSANPKVYTSALTYSEIYSVFYRALREGVLRKKQIEQLTEAFEEDWGKMIIIDTGETVLSHIPSIMKNHPLRGADGVHLASAVVLYKNGIDHFFATHDIRLFNAAVEYGLTTLPLEPSH